MSNITLCIYKDKILSEILDEIKEYLNISVEYFENINHSSNILS